MAPPRLPVPLVVLALLATPAAAQFNDGYNFLKAVKDRDGTEATKLLDKPGSIRKSIHGS